VHSDDAGTIADNVAAIGDIADTARYLTGLREVVVAPLALYYPRSATPRRFSEPLIRPWLAASLIQAALAGITSITLAEDVLEGITSGGADALRFISSLVECAGLEVLRLKLALPIGVHAAIFKCTGQTPYRILAANLSPRPAMISLAEARLRAKSATDAVTGVQTQINDHKVDIPEFGIKWIEGQETT
jgi:hypothetical protein